MIIRCDTARKSSIVSHPSRVYTLANIFLSQRVSHPSRLYTLANTVYIYFYRTARKSSTYFFLFRPQGFIPSTVAIQSSIVSAPHWPLAPQRITLATHNWIRSQRVERVSVLRGNEPHVTWARWMGAAWMTAGDLVPDGMSRRGWTRGLVARPATDEGPAAKWWPAGWHAA